MFQMKTVGKTIANLRKAHNMTQMELADQLNISFQAVSNWERGNSMPDIAKLPELAQFFGVTIDEILGESSPIVNHAAQGDLKLYLTENPPQPAQLAQAAPLLKPQQMEEAVSEMTSQKDLPDLEALEDLLPFLPEEILVRLAKRECAENELENLEQLAPFLPEGALDPLVRENLRDTSPEDLTAFFPFLSQETLDQIARQAAVSCDPDELESLLPFLSQQALADAAKAAFSHCDLEDLESFFPFLSQPALDDLAKQAAAHSAPEGLESLLPFLSQQALADAAKASLSHCRLEDLESFFPFLSQPTLTQLTLEEYTRNGMDAIPEALLDMLHKDGLIHLAQLAAQKEGLPGILPLASRLDKAALAQIFSQKTGL